MRSDPATRWPDMHALIRAVHRRRRGPVWLLGASALAVGVASTAWVRGPNPGCLLDPEGTRARWRELRSKRPLAALDTYVERWVQASKTACNAGNDHPCLSSARAELEELLTRIESSDGADVVPWVAQLPDAQLEFATLAEARAGYVDALRYAEQQQLPESASARCLARRASIDRQLSDPSATQTLRRAAQLLEATDADPLDRAFAKFELAQAEDDPSRATEALHVLPAEGAVAERLRVQITGWLEQHGP